MQLSYSIIALTAFLGRTLAIPTITPVPTPSITTCASDISCSKYATTTVYTQFPCPEYCVPPGSPICPHLPCPMPLCAVGETMTIPPLPPITTILGTKACDCTATVEADRGCAICGCLGCPECVKATATP